MHVHETSGVADLIREVTAALELRLVELEILRTGNLHQHSETHAVGAVVLHKTKRIDAVTTRLAHGLAVGAHDRGMDDDMLEGDLARAVHGRHHHTGNPKAHDIASRGKNLCGVCGLELGGVVAVSSPAHGGKRPKLRREPGVKHVGILTDFVTAFGAHMHVLDAGILPTAMIAIEHGDTMTPPQLARDAPILQVGQPVKVNLLPASRMELDLTVLDHTGRFFLKAVNRDEPLL